MKLLKTFLLLIIGFALVFGVGPAFADDDMDLFDELEDTGSSSSSDEDDPFAEMENDSSDEDDPFADMEDGAEEAKPENPAFKFAKGFGENIGGKAQLRYHYFFFPAEPRNGLDESRHYNDYLVKLETFSSWDDFRIDINAWAEGGTQHGTYAGATRWFQDNMDYRRHLEVNELYSTITFDDFDIIAGKKIFKNGVSTLFSPADRFRPTDGNDPLSPKDYGIWQTTINYYIKEYTLTGAFLPVYSPSKIPHFSSRWWGKTQSLDDPSNLSSDPNTSYVEEEPEIDSLHFGYFGKVKTTFKGWDLFASAYSGPNPYSVVKQEKHQEEILGIPVTKTTKIKKIVRANHIVGGFSTTHKKWEFHGESLYSYAVNGRDDEYLTTVLGTTYTIDDWAQKVFLEQIIFTGEYSFEQILRHQWATDYIDSSRSSRPGKNDMYGRISLKYNEDLEFELGANYDLTNRSRLQRAQGEYKLMKGLYLTVAVEFFDGSDEEDSNDDSSNDGSFGKLDYGKFKDNDRVITTLEYKF